MIRKNLVWLASYPKSGNTWFRSFLSALLNENEFDINNLEEGKVFSRKSKMEEILDLNSSILNKSEIDCYLPEVYKYISSITNDLQFFKVHNSFGYNIENQAIIPEYNTLCALYFVRNPLDISISYSNHNGCDFDETICDMNNEEFEIGNDFGRQFQQKLSTWSKHFISWTKFPKFPVYVIRYEDMLTDTFTIFKSAITNIGLYYPDSSIQNAINQTSFEKLKMQEEEKGFNEKPQKSKRFFNNGKSGTWEGLLTESQIEKIINNHGEVMKELGYL